MISLFLGVKYARLSVKKPPQEDNCPERHLFSSGGWVFELKKGRKKDEKKDEKETKRREGGIMEIIITKISTLDQGQWSNFWSQPPFDIVFGLE
jgi:hypothetical protein